MITILIDVLDWLFGHEATHNAVAYTVKLFGGSTLVVVFGAAAFRAIVGIVKSRETHYDRYIREGREMIAASPIERERAAREAAAHADYCRRVGITHDADDDDDALIVPAPREPVDLDAATAAPCAGGTDR